MGPGAVAVGRRVERHHPPAALDTLATAARIAVDEGHLRADTDPGQVAFEAWGIMLATHDAGRLLGDPKVAVRSQRAFDALLARHR